MKINSQYFNIFGRVIKDDSLKVSFKDMNSYSYFLGILVPESLCYQWLLDELLKRDIDYNSTFYKSWEDIQSKSRQELWLDQLKHYVSTYGTDFQGEAWTPNDSDKDYQPIIKELKVLEGVTKEEALSDIKQLAYSNIAFSNEVLGFLIEFKDQLEVDKIQNRTLKMNCIDENYQFKDGQECLNYILYKYFGIQMLVKNLDTLGRIASTGTNLGLEYLIKKNENILASVFYRNKDVFIRLKGVISPQEINRIRKLAKKYHKPMSKSVWLRLNEISEEERQELFDRTPIFKLVQMYNTLTNPTGYYIIRNGKAFYRESRTREVSYQVVQQLLFTIINKVPKVESVSLPKGISLAMPTSEKNFIGDIPLGSYVDCSDKNTMVGIYWKNDWGARDLDLHVKTIDGSNIGWNAEYVKDGDILFSGDMTDAPTGASEVMWFKKEPIESIVSVCKYYGDDTYHYDMFIAQEEATDFKENYMVNPNNVVYKARIALEGKSDVTLGYFNDNKFVFHSCNVGNNLVPSKWREFILKHLVQCDYLQVSTVLEAAGVKVSEDSEIKITSKGDLIKFFSAS